MKKIFLQLVFVLAALFLYSAVANAATIKASRGVGAETCVAPCSIFFEDLDGTIDSAVAGETKPFHNYHYVWDFGDVSSGNWGLTSRPKNEATGALASHIFESPGSFVVALRVYDPVTKSQVASDQVTVNIGDPDEIYAADMTTCVSDTENNDFFGCPEEANRISTDDLQSVVGYAESGERLLLDRGSSWDLFASWDLPDHAGPVEIGAYGACIESNNQGICANNPMIKLSAQQINTFLMSDKQNWVVRDIAMTGYNDSGRFIVAGSRSQHNSYIRLKAEAMEQIFFTQASRASDAEEEKLKYNFFVDSYGGPSIGAGMNFWGSGEYMVISGNEFLGAKEHTIRLYQAYKTIISHNRLSGASYGTGPNYYGGHALKLHSPCEAGYTCLSKVGSFAETGKTGLENRTKFVIIADNVFGGSAPWPVALAPQNSSYDERLSDIIFERNKVIAEYGTPPHSIMTGIYASGRDYSIRNNIIDGSSGSKYMRGIMIVKRGAEPPPSNMDIYNNTIYRGDSGDYQQRGVGIDAEATAINVRNNLFSYPFWTANHIILDDRALVADSSNNIISAATIFSDPDNSDPLLRDFHLNSSAIDMIDQGFSVAVYDDFAANKRSGAYDIGAYEYQGDAATTNYRFDVDGSAKIDTTDALLALRYSLDLDMTSTSWQEQSSTGDVNCDGTTSSSDALLILRYALGFDMSGTEWCG